MVEHLSEQGDAPTTQLRQRQRRSKPPSQPRITTPKIRVSSMLVSELTKIEGMGKTPVKVTCAPRDTPDSTPDRLRLLEQGWRAKRRRVLGELSPSGNPSTGEMKPLDQCKSNGRMEGGTDIRRGTSKAKSTGVPIVTRPLTPPDTPPPDDQLPLQPPNPQIISSPSLTSTSKMPPKCTLQPIMAHPLPSTSRPVPILTARVRSAHPGSRTRIRNHASHHRDAETITIHPPGSKYSLTLKLDQSLFNVSSDGTVLYILKGADDAWIRDTRLDLNHKAEFTERETNQWRIVQELLERIKRNTTRIKMWTATGRLSISCSSPPDITLVFALEPSKGAPGGGKKGHDSTKVRLVYSTLSKEMTIDVAVERRSLSQTGYSYRSRRCIELSDILALGERKDRSDRGVRDVSEKMTVDTSTAAAKLGVTRVQHLKLAEEENEAIRRFWVLHEDWEKWL